MYWESLEQLAETKEYNQHYEVADNLNSPIGL
jgi:hypothetical protein